MKAIVVDEAHLVVDWKAGNNRKQSSTSTIAWSHSHCYQKDQNYIIESLGMVNAVEILGNPYRPNIYFSSSSRPDRGEDKLNEILVPLVESLKKERTKFPFAVVFGTLETISSCYAFFS